MAMNAQNEEDFKEITAAFKLIIDKWREKYSILAVIEDTDNSNRVFFGNCCPACVAREMMLMMMTGDLQHLKDEDESSTLLGKTDNETDFKKEIDIKLNLAKDKSLRKAKTRGKH